MLSFQNRVELIIEQEGKSITNILRNGIHQSPKDNIIINENYSILTIEDLIQNVNQIQMIVRSNFSLKRLYISEEDLLLLNLVSQCGTRWKDFTKYFQYRTAISLCQHYKKIIGIR